MFNPQRLILARMRRKISSSTLAKKAGISAVTLSRIENAVNEPLEENIKKFSEELNFPISFFMGEDLDVLSEEAASFRSMKSITAKERDAALASASFAYKLSDWIEERFELPELDLPVLDDGYSPEQAAIILRQHWGIGNQPINNLVKLLESKGVKVFTLAESTQTVDAFCCWRNEKPYVFLNTFKSAERSRFDAAHELGHLVMHRNIKPNHRQSEMEANAFASALLMPSDDVRSHISHVGSLGQLIQLKKRWKVSLAALVYRLHKMDILSEYRYRSLCIQLGKYGYRTKEPEGIEREQSVVWKQIFTELWNEKETKNTVAQKLDMPLNELDNLIYGLNFIQPNNSKNTNSRLTLVQNN